MDFQIRYAKPALAHLEEILDYSLARFPSTTERFGSAILDHVEVLRAFPYIGKPVRRRPGVRQLTHAPIIIYYRVLEDPRIIEILGFRHGSRRPFHGGVSQASTS